jgi:hypothetical protein
MSKPSVVYVIFAILLVGGIWAILLAGSKLDAPPHIEGAWNIHWDGSPEAQRLHLEQAGLFVTARLDRARLHGKLISADKRFELRLIDKGGAGVQLGPISDIVVGKIAVTSTTQPARRGFAVRQPTSSQPSNAH